MESMTGGFASKPGGSSRVQDALDDGTTPLAPGKRTLTEALPAAGSGHPLDAPLQAKMSAAFGADLSGVRVHHGDHAERLGADAFTHGADIHFAPGQYDPGSERGQALIGHELAHVVQQRSGRVAPTIQAHGLAMNADEALEREADAWGQAAARGERIATAAAGTAAAAPVVQGRFKVGRKVWTGDDAEALRQHGRVRGESAAVINAVVALAGEPGLFQGKQVTWDAVLAEARRRAGVEVELDERVDMEEEEEEEEEEQEQGGRGRGGPSNKRRRSSDGTTAPTAKNPRSDLSQAPAPSSVPSSSSSSSSSAPSSSTPMIDHLTEWMAYQQRFQADVRDVPDDASKSDADEHFVATMSAVATHKHNIATFIPLDLLAPEPRQTNPFQIRQPDKYYRSQDEHGLLSMIDQTPNGPASNEARDEVWDLWDKSRNSRYGLTGPERGHIGLRPSDASMFEGYFTDTRYNEIQGAVPERDRDAHRPPPIERSSDAIDPTSPSVNNGLSLSQQATGAVFDLAQVLAQPERHARPDHDDPQGEPASSSYILRRLDRSGDMARQLMALVDGQLKHVTLHYQTGNPSLTIYLTALASANSSANKDTRERMVEWLQAYFAGRASVHAASLGIPLGLQIRQSFAFLDTTVANTALSIRLSFGSEPPEYLAALAGALLQFDTDIGVVAQAMESGELTHENGPWNVTSEERKYAGVYQAMLGEEGGVLDFLHWVVNGTANDLGKRATGKDKLSIDNPRSRHLQRMRDQATAVLRERLAAAQDQLERLDEPDTSLPIQADLDDAVMLAAHLIDSLDLEAPQRFPGVIAEALSRLRAAAQRAVQVLQSVLHDITERGHAHTLLRNATTTIIDTCYVLAAAADAHRGRDPVAEQTARVRKLTRNNDATMHFADSGSQAMLSGSLAQLPSEGGTLDLATEPDIYYEVPNIGNAINGPPRGATADASVRIGTTAPHAATPPELQSDRPAPGTPTMDDATNSDLLSHEYLDQLPATTSMVASSNVKLAQLGSDRHQQGWLLDLRPPDASRAQVPQFPMSRQDRQTLAMLADLRKANEVDVTPYVGAQHDDLTGFRELLEMEQDDPEPHAQLPRPRLEDLFSGGSGRVGSTPPRSEPPAPSSSLPSSSRGGPPPMPISGQQLRDIIEGVELGIAQQQSFTLATGALGTYMTIVNASEHGHNCLIFAIAGGAGISLSAKRAAKIRAKLGGGTHYLGTDAIPTAADLLGVQVPIVVIRTDGHDRSDRFSVERFGDGDDPIYLPNAANIHFGHATVKPGFRVEEANTESDPGIRFVPQG